MEPKITHFAGDDDQELSRVYRPGERILKAGNRYTYFCVVDDGAVLLAHDRGRLADKPSEALIQASDEPEKLCKRTIGVRDYFMARATRFDHCAVTTVKVRLVDSPLLIAKRMRNELDPIMRLLALDPDFGAELYMLILKELGMGMGAPPVNDPRQVIKLVEAFNAGPFAKKYMETLSKMVYALLKRRNKIVASHKQADPNAEEQSMVFDEPPIRGSIISG